MGSNALQLNAKSGDGSQLLYPLPPDYTLVHENVTIVKHPQKHSLRPYTMMVPSDDRATCSASLRFRKKHPELLIQIVYGVAAQSEPEYTKLKVYI
jgi:hypothetical protein